MVFPKPTCGFWKTRCVFFNHMWVKKNTHGFSKNLKMIDKICFYDFLQKFVKKIKNHMCFLKPPWTFENHLWVKQTTPGFLKNHMWVLQKIHLGFSESIKNHMWLFLNHPWVLKNHRWFLKTMGGFWIKNPPVVFWKFKNFQFFFQNRLKNFLRVQWP